MKMRFCGFLYFLGFSLLSTGFTNCELIPNTRVIAYNAGADDFTLVEGITYNIVHIKSGLNLDSAGGDAYISSPKSNGINNPFQFWVLRKADSSSYAKGLPVYNIIHVRSGRNLDCNSDGNHISISTPPNNSKTNAFQHWILSKIGYNVYNILHVLTDYRNLDSNGNNILEISSPQHNFVGNPYQHWAFRPVYYKFSTMITDVVYPKDLNSTLEQYKKRVNIFEGNYVIENPTNAIIQQTIDKTELKSNIYSLEINKTETVQISETNSVSFSIGAEFFKILGINTGFTNGVTKTFESTIETTYKKVITDNITYHIQHTITVPANTSIAVEATVNKIDLEIPFQAKYRVNANAMRLDDNGSPFEADVDADALRCYLQNAKSIAKNAVIVENSLLSDTSGSIKVNAYGIDTTIKTRAI